MTVRRLNGSVLAAILLAVSTPYAGSALASSAGGLSPARYAAAPAIVPGHSALRSAVPADQAVLDHGPTEIVLTFNEEINPRFTQLALSRSGSLVPTEPATASGAVLRTRLADPGPGAYRIAFRVVSADGHPISGETTFTVRGAQPPATSAASPSGTGPATPSAAAPATASPAAPTRGDATPAADPGSQEGLTWLYLGGALLALAAAAGFWESRRKRR